MYDYQLSSIQCYDSEVELLLMIVQGSIGEILSNLSVWSIQFTNKKVAISIY